MKRVNIKNNLNKMECIKSEICKIYEGPDVGTIGNDFGYGIYQFITFLNGKKNFEDDDVIDLILQSKKRFFKKGTTLEEICIKENEYKEYLKNKIKKGF